MKIEYTMGQNAWDLDSLVRVLVLLLLRVWNKQSDMYVKRSIPISYGFIIINRCN